MSRSPQISREALSKIRRLRSESLEGVLGENTRLLNSHLQTSSPELNGSSFAHGSSFAPSLEEPPLLEWIVPALTCAMCYALYNIFIKKGSASIHPILGGVILQIAAAILGALLCGFLAFGPPQEPMFYDFRGFSFAILAGIAVGAAEILSFLVNGKSNLCYKIPLFCLRTANSTESNVKPLIIAGRGVPAVKSIPIIVGGSVMFGTILGRVFLAELLSLRGWFGVILIAIGIALVGMESEGGH
ncbi:hypothetical protein ACHAXR_007708 [Thalassiosira sp. AJA248-18]